MRYSILCLLLILGLGCDREVGYDIPRYFSLVHQAEGAICLMSYPDAADQYRKAFTFIDKPFGKDVYNAALANHLAGQTVVRNKYVQVIINNTPEMESGRTKFVPAFISEEEWSDLLSG